MKENVISSMIDVAKKVFEIIKMEYQDFLTLEKIELINNLNYSNLFKITDDNLPPVYLENETFYLKDNLNLDTNLINPYLNYLRNNNLETVYQELIIYMCLKLLCGEINPLKLGLIEKEVRYLANKYNIKTSNINNYKELEIANLVSDLLLDDLPVNIIFFDNNIEIFNYLTEEKGIKIAKLYHEISRKMISKYKGFSSNNFDLISFSNYYNDINYEDISDLIYDFINQKIRT